MHERQRNIGDRQTMIVHDHLNTITSCKQHDVDPGDEPAFQLAESAYARGFFLCPHCIGPA